MSFDKLEITDYTLRDDLLSYITDLEEEVEKLERLVREKEHEIADLCLAPEQRDRLEEAAEMMAAQGYIHNTPAGKARWIEGR